MACGAEIHGAVRIRRHTRTPDSARQIVRHRSSSDAS
jgi:hypothetical protein